MKVDRWKAGVAAAVVVTVLAAYWKFSFLGFLLESQTPIGLAAKLVFVSSVAVGVAWGLWKRDISRFGWPVALGLGLSFAPWLAVTGAGYGVSADWKASYDKAQALRGTQGEERHYLDLVLNLQKAQEAHRSELQRYEATIGDLRSTIAELEPRLRREYELELQTKVGDFEQRSATFEETRAEVFRLKDEAERKISESATVVKAAQAERDAAKARTSQLESQVELVAARERAIAAKEIAAVETSAQVREQTKFEVAKLHDEASANAAKARQEFELAVKLRERAEAELTALQKASASAGEYAANLKSSSEQLKLDATSTRVALTDNAKVVEATLAESKSAVTAAVAEHKAAISNAISGASKETAAALSSSSKAVSEAIVANNTAVQAALVSSGEKSTAALNASKKAVDEAVSRNNEAVKSAIATASKENAAALTASNKSLTDALSANTKAVDLAVSTAVQKTSDALANSGRDTTVALAASNKAIADASAANQEALKIAFSGASKQTTDVFTKLTSDVTAALIKSDKVLKEVSAAVALSDAADKSFRESSALSLASLQGQVGTEMNDFRKILASLDSTVKTGMRDQTAQVTEVVSAGAAVNRLSAEKLGEFSKLIGAAVGSLQKASEGAIALQNSMQADIASIKASMDVQQKRPTVGPAEMKTLQTRLESVQRDNSLQQKTVAGLQQALSEAQTKLTSTQGRIDQVAEEARRPVSVAAVSAPYQPPVPQVGVSAKPTALLAAADQVWSSAPLRGPDCAKLKVTKRDQWELAMNTAFPGYSVSSIDVDGGFVWGTSPNGEAEAVPMTKVAKMAGCDLSNVASAGGK